MIRRALMAITAILILNFTSVTVAKRFKELSPDMAGSMKPFDFSRVDTKGVWADSLQPVYVAHVARHGARFLSSADKVEKLKRVLAEARTKGSLTKEGVKFGAMLADVEKVTGDDWGRLSSVGCEEESRLAENLYNLLPDLMSQARVNAVSSYVPRVVKTMYEYNHQLSTLSSEIEIMGAEGRQFDWLMRCFSADPAYADYRKEGEWKKVVEKMTDSIVSPEPARRLLGNKAGFSEEKLRKFTLDMYGVLQSLPAFGMAAPTDEFMSEEEYRACWMADNLEHYLRNTINPLSDVAGKATSPLLARIISDADASLGNALLAEMLGKADMASKGKGGSVDIGVNRSVAERFDANFYFGHAETLMPLLSLMEVEGCYTDNPDLSTLAERWRDYEVVPLGANLDLIFLVSPSQRVYVTMRHNCRFVAPMGGQELIVPWNDYRGFLIRRMTNS